MTYLERLHQLLDKAFIEGYNKARSEAAGDAATTASATKATASAKKASRSKRK